MSNSIDKLIKNKIILRRKTDIIRSTITEYFILQDNTNNWIDLKNLDEVGSVKLISDKIFKPEIERNEALLIDDTRERVYLANLIGLNIIPDKNSYSFDSFYGLFDKLLNKKEIEIDALKTLKEIKVIS